MTRALVVAVLAGCGRAGFDPNSCIDAIVVPADYNVAFVTSTLQVPTTFGGDLAGADALCNARAGAAGLTGTYIALLSNSTTAARDRLTGSRGWVRSDGKPLLDRPEDIAAGKMFVPLATDEFGNTAPADDVATGTLTDGTPSNNDCAGYSSAASMITAGTLRGTSFNWLSNASSPCSAQMRVYCFGLGKSKPLSPPGNGRLAFMTVQPYVVDSGGIATADALCASEAKFAGLEGTYLALLSTTTASAMSRFSLSGANWVRLDGAPVAASPLDLAAGNLETTINLDTVGDYQGHAYIATGIETITRPSSNLSETCGDWTDPAGFANTAVANQVDTAFEETTAGSCTTSSIYCLEQ